MSVIDILRSRQPLAFVDYMQQALYAPGLGYYSSGRQKFGKDGDFVTAPELTPLFGYTLANQCQEIMSKLTAPCIFEFGAGSGRLCVDILTALEKLESLPDYYYILELSADLQQRQKSLIDQQLPHLAQKVIWLDQWPKEPFEGVVIANEVLDAMPVHRFLQTNEGLQESFISIDAQGNLEEHFKPCTNKRLAAYLKEALPETLCPYLSEANLFIEGWIKECFSMLKKGLLLLIDYGFPRHEYYHPDRHQGTLICHYQHRSHSNFLANPGEQDITAHVDFTHVAEAGDAAGFKVCGFSDQASFLLSNGLLDLLERIPEDKERIFANQAIKQLLHPSEMGELFKVMALSKGYDGPLQGFLLANRLRCL